MKYKKIAIVGSRTFPDLQLVKDTVKNFSVHLFLFQVELKALTRLLSRKPAD